MLRAPKLLGLALFGTTCFACGAILGPRTVDAGDPAFGAIAQLGRVLVQIETHYVEPVERSRLVEGAIKGMVDELDPHSSYFRPDEWKAFQSETEGKFGGVGVEVDLRDGLLRVIAPIEGSPAERAGIKSGDIIVQIDGQDVERAGQDRVLRRMRGDPGTKVRLVVVRDQKSIPFDLTREIIAVKSVSARMMQGGVAYVRVRQFQERTHGEFVAAIARVTAEAKARPRGVLLDLRSNPGGLVDEASDIADEFLAEGSIYSLRARNAIVEEAKATRGGVVVDLPCVALVNGWSASASELLVGALQDHGRAEVVGQTTFGKGSVQSVIELPDGAGLKLTSARYYTPSGHAIQADGIHPDVLIVPPHADKTLRERDLAGRLAAEGVGGGAARPRDGARDGGIEVHMPDGGVEAMVPSREVPEDPRGTNDFALKLGYEELLKRMK